MINQINGWMFFICALLLASCVPDSEQFIPINGNSSVDGALFGIVLSEDGDPIADALITYNSRTATTNERGLYQFENVKIDTKHNHLNIKKAGYFETTKTFRTNESREITLRSRLLKKEFNHSIGSVSGGDVSEGVTSLKFPADAIVTEATGEDYNGEVLVALRHINPTERFTGEIMPGDLSAVDQDGNYSVLTSFGMNYVELESPNGAKLQVKAGKTVTMESKVPDDILDNAPSSIPMWYFDTNIGLWKEEGFAELRNGKYVGEVSHFSCWNYDANDPSIILSGRVVNQDGVPFGNVHVWVSAVGQWGGGHGNTNGDGTFSGPVAKDQDLILKIFDYECGAYDTPIFTTTLSPLSQDTDIGDIVLNSVDEHLVSVKATALNCDGNPIDEGVAIINGSYFKFQNGDLDFNFLVCDGNTNLDMLVINVNELTQSNIIPLVVGDNNLGVISGCEIDLFHIGIKCDGLDIDQVALFEIRAKKSLNLKRLYGYVDSTWTWIEIKYDDNFNDGFKVGNYSLVAGYVSIADEINGGDLGIEYELVSGSVVITEVNDTEKYIVGSYTMKTTESGNEYDFYGTFKLKSD